MQNVMALKNYWLLIIIKTILLFGSFIVVAFNSNVVFV
jgi:hypothetical protein